jgi:hypothetical protein
MILKILIGTCAFILLVYLLSRVQMRAWIHELDSKLTEYLPKNDKDAGTKS